MHLQEINQLDLFSGIGGFHLGFERAGYKVNSYFSEVDKHAVAVYKNQFKDSTYVGSVTDVRGADLPRIDLITFGSPCQDFSLAGKRKGMGGERSSLITEAIRLVHECRPRVFIWENVKGTFSSNNGADFWAVVRAFANIGNYRLEWQLLNTNWLLPQNRERIYLVGHLAGKSEPKVFPIGQDDIFSFSTHTESKRERKWVQVQPNRCAGTLTRRSHKMGVDDNYVRIIDPEVKGLREIRTEEAKKIRRESNKKGVDFCPRRGKEIVKRLDDVTGTITASPSVDTMVSINNVVRRLTPVEFERLQGFDDDWTKYGIYDGTKKEISDTQRYKLMGNAVTTSIVELIASKL